jgi:cardiolipin synthase
MRPRWRDGNRITLLENGETFFPRVFEVMEAARSEILLETFIWFDDEVGRQLHGVLLRAAQRGVSIDVTVDGYGSANLSREFLDPLVEAGVRLHVFDPRPKVLGLRTNLFRRMHRKILVVDGERAFIGGINFSADHLYSFGPEAKQDYSSEILGPIVEDIHRFARLALVPPSRRRLWGRRPEARSDSARQARAGDAQMLLVTRDNAEHRSDIERHYRVAIRAARREVVIANAYFFPGYRLLRELRRAAGRGVRVRLILQGQPDMPIVKIAAGLLHDYLLHAGVTIYEYCERPLHGKVAYVDEEWSTIGSSNLDPLSLSLNLEANVMVRDRGFNQELRRSLERLIERHCIKLDAVPDRKPPPWRSAVTTVVFHFLRRFPAWAGWLPAHSPRIKSLSPPVESPLLAASKPMDPREPEAALTDATSDEAPFSQRGIERMSERPDPT